VTSLWLVIFERWWKWGFKNLFLVSILKITDENSRIRSQIRIRTKMSRILNTDRHWINQTCPLKATRTGQLPRKYINKNVSTDIFITTLILNTKPKEVSRDLLKMRDSATRPPRAMHIRSMSSSGEKSFRSVGVYCANPSAWLVRGKMVTCPQSNVINKIWKWWWKQKKF
jgi:hypothetical protein